MNAGINNLYGYVLRPLRASEHIDPKLVSGADTPTPMKERKDSRKIADGICRNVVVMICPIQFGSRCLLMIRPPFGPLSHTPAVLTEGSVHG